MTSDASRLDLVTPGAFRFVEGIEAITGIVIGPADGRCVGGAVCRRGGRPVMSAGALRYG